MVIEFIWDFVPAHKSEDILSYAIELGITVSFVPVGLTIILQVCNLLVNKALKSFFWK